MHQKWGKRHQSCIFFVYEICRTSAPGKLFLSGNKNFAWPDIRAWPRLPGCRISGTSLLLIFRPWVRMRQVVTPGTPCSSGSKSFRGRISWRSHIGFHNSDPNYRKMGIQPLRSGSYPLKKEIPSDFQYASLVFGCVIIFPYLLLNHFRHSFFNKVYNTHTLYGQECLFIL